jgi:hypothetical protein
MKAPSTFPHIAVYIPNLDVVAVYDDVGHRELFACFHIDFNSQPQEFDDLNREQQLN